MTLTIEFPCSVCQSKLSADASFVGKKMRCPQCLAAVTVPAPQSAVVPAQAEPSYELANVGHAFPETTALAPAPAPPLPPPRSSFNPRKAGKRYGFKCPYCSSGLEATEDMAAQDGQCPTCGNQITIPILDRYNRLIDPKTRQIIKQDPHPVHAYAAAGDRAPAIYRDKDGFQFIRCAKCKSSNLINANNCKICGMPFTMEGTTVEATQGSNGFAVASLVLGVVGLLPACMFTLPVLAIIFGTIALNQISKVSEAKGKGIAIAGIVLGVIGCLITASFYHFI